MTRNFLNCHNFLKMLVRGLRTRSEFLLSVTPLIGKGQWNYAFGEGFLRSEGKICVGWLKGEVWCDQVKPCAILVRVCICIVCARLWVSGYECEIVNVRGRDASTEWDAGAQEPRLHSPVQRAVSTIWSALKAETCRRECRA